MSSSIMPIECIGLEVNSAYIENLIEDIKSYRENPESFKKSKKENQIQILEKYAGTIEDALENPDDYFDLDEDFHELDDLTEDIFYQILKGDEDIWSLDIYSNYARVSKIYLEYNQKHGKIDDGNSDFVGILFRITVFPSNIFKPIFSNVDDLKNAIENEFYIPRNFNWKEYLKYISAIQEG